MHRLWRELVVNSFLWWLRLSGLVSFARKILRTIASRTTLYNGLTVGEATSNLVPQLSVKLWTFNARMLLNRLCLLSFPPSYRPSFIFLYFKVYIAFLIYFMFTLFHDVYITHIYSSKISIYVTSVVATSRKRWPTSRVRIRHATELHIVEDGC